MRAYLPAVALLLLAACAFVYAIRQTLGDTCPKFLNPTRKDARDALAIVCALLIVTVTGGVPPLPVCPLEDSPSCIWLAPVQGNGIGRTVVNGPLNT